MKFFTLVLLTAALLTACDQPAPMPSAPQPIPPSNPPQVALVDLSRTAVVDYATFLNGWKATNPCTVGGMAFQGGPNVMILTLKPDDDSKQIFKQVPHLYELPETGLILTVVSGNGIVYIEVAR